MRYVNSCALCKTLEVQALPFMIDIYSRTFLLYRLFGQVILNLTLGYLQYMMQFWGWKNIGSHQKGVLRVLGLNMKQVCWEYIPHSDKRAWIISKRLYLFRLGLICKIESCKLRPTEVSSRYGSDILISDTSFFLVLSIIFKIVRGKDRKPKPQLLRNSKTNH